MDIRKTIREEIDDFDWAKETNPIQYKDLKGYYFFYGNNPKKYIISDVTKKDDYGINRVHYVWWDIHNDEYDENSMDCDTLINRVKNGGYKLYDKNGVEVNPRDLVYTDNTFDDDERKEIWEQDESEDEWEWARTTKPIELQDPKEWIGRQFGYDEEIFTITGIDENDNLILIKHHPVYGDNHDSSTSPRNLRDYISKGKWVWI